jgi:hypothetical protein
MFMMMFDCVIHEEGFVCSHGPDDDGLLCSYLEMVIECRVTKNVMEETCRQKKSAKLVGLFKI